MTQSAPAAIAAHGFFPDLPGSRLEGLVEIGSVDLAFVAPGRAAVRLPLHGIEIRVTGIQHEILLLSHPSLPGVAVSAATADLVGHPVLLAQPEVARQLGRARGQERRGRMIVPGCILFVILSLVSLWLLKDPMIAWVADRIPHSVEESLGGLLFSAIEAQTPMIADPELDRELEQLVEPLAAAARAEGRHLDFHLTDDPSLNAFAVPGGHVVIHSGLILEAGRAEELLGVVAHEIAHVTERHSLRQMVGSAGLWVLFQSLFGDFSGLAGTVAEGGYNLLTLSFSRDQELDADQVGVRTLAAARIDPRGLGDFFDRIEKESAAAGGAKIDAALSFLSTHPVTAERKSRLEAQVAALPAQSFEPVATDYEAFRQRVLAGSPLTRAALDAKKETP